METNLCFRAALCASPIIRIRLDSIRKNLAAAATDGQQTIRLLYIKLRSLFACQVQFIYIGIISSQAIYHGQNARPLLRYNRTLSRK